MTRPSFDFVRIQPTPQIDIDLRYSGANNFMGKPLYSKMMQNCFLHQVAAEKFDRACRSLEKQRPDLQFLIWDALRPQSTQRVMFDFVTGTPYENYVANPEVGSMHSFGMAIDLTLKLREGAALDMGTDFDDFRDLAQPHYEAKHLASGLLTPEQLSNRLLLRSLLEENGFQVLPHEWWHFNALTSKEVLGVFPMLRTEDALFK